MSNYIYGRNTVAAYLKSNTDVKKLYIFNKGNFKLKPTLYIFPIYTKNVLHNKKGTEKSALFTLTIKISV